MEKMEMSLLEKLQDWLKTPEGKEAMKQAKQDQVDLLKRFKEARNISLEDLHRPMTI